MIKGTRIILRDKLVFKEEQGTLRQTGKALDLLQNISNDTGILHIVDLNAKNGNMTNFDLYDHLTYKVNIEVECAPKEELVKKLFLLGARTVLELPCKLDLQKFNEKRRLLVGKTDGKVDERVHDYYLESDDLEKVKELSKKGRVLIYSKTIKEKEAEDAGAFALIQDY
ncbi:hypothetical protein KJ780_00510 [Candidatus Micrarchaeota archaeon]|nr:hypothetical protein [Candidatus Micrarchaeota archaeon]